MNLDCRLCLQSVSSGYLLSSKEIGTHFPVLSLQQIMEQMCQVAFDRDGESRLPKSLCKTCKDGLIAAYILRLTAKESDILLRVRLDKVKTEEESGDDSPFEDNNHKMSYGLECRLCLQNISSGFLLSSKEIGTHFPVLTLQQIMEQICLVAFVPDEKTRLPKSICKACKDGLIAAYILRLTAKESDILLRDQENKLGYFIDSQSVQDFSSHALPDRLPKKISPFGDTGPVFRADEEEEENVDDEEIEDNLNPGNYLEAALVELSQDPQPGQIDKDPSSDTPAKPFKCPHCEKTFKEADLLEAHAPICSKSATLNCEQCGHTYKYQLIGKLISHVRSQHTDLDSHKCSFCVLTFPTGDSLASHMRDDHNPYQCPVCDKGYRHLSRLQHHMKFHSKAGPLRCVQCGKNCRTKLGLETHIARHNGQSSFPCDQCPCSFLDVHSLKAHLISHTDERPFVCEICGKAFRGTVGLKHHKRVHNGEKPYACQYCEKSFTSGQQRIQHERIHTGERPYKCTHCEKAFMLSHDLVRHTRTHLGKLIYKCDDCGAAFRLKTELKLHFNAVHFRRPKDAAGQSVGSSATSANASLSV